MGYDVIHHGGRRDFLKLTGGVGVAGILAGCVGDSNSNGSGDDAEDRGGVIEMTDDLKFVPDAVEIDVGDTVIWENVGSVGHSVTAYEDDIPKDATYFASGGFDTESTARDGWPDGDIAGEETYRQTIETAGEYEYFCIPHESAGMVGSLTVR